MKLPVFCVACFVACASIAAMLSSDKASSSPVTADEHASARVWISRYFEVRQFPDGKQPGLHVLENHGPVANTRGPDGFNISGHKYDDGLFCHAISRVVVVLPCPASRFQASIGIDSNPSTQPGHGNVIFSISRGGTQLFHSENLHEGMPPVPVDVPLGGAAELTLDVSDADAGIAYDQSDWADAAVTLTNGKTLRLADMPIFDEQLPVLDTDAPPFNFVYHGQNFTDLWHAWRVSRSSTKLDAQRTRHSVVYTDPKTHLVVDCSGTEYLDFPTVDWMVTFRNKGQADTPIIKNVEPMYLDVQRNSTSDFNLHYFEGSIDSAEDYQPRSVLITQDVTVGYTSRAGRPTDPYLPFFNVDWTDGGAIVGLGWPGQWSAEFHRNGDQGLDIHAGQQQTRFLLHPGESVRTPRVVMQFWRGGDWIRAQNIWRRWMIAHNMPRPNGEAMKPQINICPVASYDQFVNADETNQLSFLKGYLDQGIKPDYFWRDAGWYPNTGSWASTGTWEVDAKRFPHGLRAIADYAHENGVKFILWMEPERVMPGTALFENHYDWLLPPAVNPGGRSGQTEAGLLNLGDPQAVDWLTRRTKSLIAGQGVDYYREDYNIEPLSMWRAHDGFDRQGITEDKYIAGHLAYWDALRQAFPQLRIDSCASGGRRNDLDTLQRAVPLLRTDYGLDATYGPQCQTYGMSFWIPFYGGGTDRTDSYEFRSEMTPSLTICYVPGDPGVDWNKVRTLLDQWRQVSPDFMGDYYPLTPYSLANDVWMAWQFDRPEAGQGMVEAFRRAGNSQQSALYKLRGLDPQATYALTDFDKPDFRSEQTGAQLMEQGMTVTLPEQSSSALIAYKKVQ